MKKSIFITLLTSALLLMPTTIKADEEVSKAGTELIALTASIPSSYTVKFPRSVNVANTEVSFNIDVKGEISKMEKIVITLPSTVTLTEEDYDSHNARSVTVNLAKTKSEFVLEDLSKDTYNEQDARSSVTLTHDAIKAGNWTGSISMVIGIENRYEDGESAPE